jgi:hypothetical protein
MISKVLPSLDWITEAKDIEKLSTDYYWFCPMQHES